MLLYVHLKCRKVPILCSETGELSRISGILLLIRNFISNEKLANLRVFSILNVVTKILIVNLRQTEKKSLVILINTSFTENKYR